MKTINFSGYIGEYPNTVEVLNMELASISATAGIIVNVSSPGGSYPEALKIYDRINEHKGKKTIRISPIAASAGAFIALVPGAKVVMPQNGLLRHHMPMVVQGEPKNSEELDKQSEQLKVIESTVIDTVVARCGKDKEYVRNFLNEDRWLTAEQALEIGLIDEVLPLSRQKTSISNLVLPEHIVAHVETLNKEISKMELKDVCLKIEVAVDDNATDEVMGEKIVSHVGTLLTTIQTLTQERDELKEVNKPPEFPERIVDILVREREGEIDRLVTNGQVSGAVAKGLKAQFADKEQIVSCVDEKGNPTDGFDGLIASLGKNEKIINFGDQKKKAKFDKGDDDDEVNPVIANAEARAKAAKR